MEELGAELACSSPFTAWDKDGLGDDTHPAAGGESHPSSATAMERNAA